MNPYFFRCWIGPEWTTYDFSYRAGQTFSGGPGWEELRDDNGQVTINMDLMDNFSGYTWSFRLQGFNLRETLVKPEYLALIEGGTSPTDLKVLAYGIIDRVEVTSDFSRSDNWSVSVVSIAERLSRRTLPPIRIGELDIAQSGSVNVSSVLAKPWKESFRNKDVSAPQHSYDGRHAIDGEPDTQWVSDGWVGDGPRNDNDHAWISMVGPVEPPDVYWGGKFIELINLTSGANPEVHVYSTQTGWKDPETNLIKNIDANDPHMGRPHAQRVLLVESQDIFQRYWPTASQAFQTIDMSVGDNKDRSFFGGMRADKGIVAVSSTSGGRSILDYVAWGTWTDIEWGDAVSAFHDSNFKSWNHANTTGKILPSPAFDQVIKKDLSRPLVHIDNETPGLYTLSRIQNVGWIIQPQDMKTHSDGTPYFEAAPENWIVLSLPEMGHVLGRDLSPGDTVAYIEDGEGSPWVEGIPESGEIFIDDEFIPYTTRDFDQGTVVILAVQRDHFAGAPVLLHHKTVNGQKKATGAWPLIDTGWKNEDFPAPRDFLFRFAFQDTAKDPGSSEHERTYDATSEKLGHTTTSHIVGHVYGMRARKIALEIGRMNRAGGVAGAERPRIGTFYAHLDKSLFDRRYWMDSMPNEDLVRYMIVRAGLPDTMVTKASGTLIRQDGVTDTDDAWFVITDAAQYGNSFIEVGLDNHIHVKPNTLLTGSWSPTENFFMGDLIALRTEQVRDTELGQMELVWELPDGSDGGSIYYPNSKAEGTITQTQGPQLFESASIAYLVAERLYHINRQPYSIFAEFSDTHLDVRPGDIHRVTWDYQASTRTVDGIASSVEISIGQGVAATRVEYREVRRV